MENKNHLGPEKNRNNSEYEMYHGLEIGLELPRGITQGVLWKEDNLHLYLLPNITYHPIPISEEKTISNPIWETKIPKKVSKNLIQITQSYQKGYLEDFVTRTKQIEIGIFDKFVNSQRNIILKK